MVVPAASAVNELRKDVRLNPEDIEGAELGDVVVVGVVT